MGEVEMLPWAVTMIKMMMCLPVMLLWVFKQAGPHLPCEEEAGRKLSHSSLQIFQVFANMGGWITACRPHVARSLEIFVGH